MRFRDLFVHRSPDDAGTAAGGTAPATPPAVTPPAPTGGSTLTPPAGTPPVPPAGAPPAPPADVVYDLKLPEKSTLDPALLERTVAIARAQGLSPAQAQAAVDLAASEITTHTATAVKAAMEAIQPGGAEWKKEIDGWKAQVLADQTLGKTPEERRATVDRGVGIVRQYAKTHPDDAPAFTQFLDNGLGDHPATVRFFAWLGDAAKEGSLRAADLNDEKPTKSTAELLYGPDGGRSKGKAVTA